MVPLLLTMLLQTPQSSAPPPSVELPVSLENVRQGLEDRSGLFELPPPPPWSRAGSRPVFRVSIQNELIEFEADPWEYTGIVPPWVRTHAPSHHFEFLSLVTPDEVRSATLYPCCNVTPVIQTVTGLVKKGIRSLQQAAARREVELLMREAGIRK